MALRVCMYQGGTCNVANNLREMDAFLAERARSNDCDVVVFSELYVCGYGRESFAEVALAPGWETESELRTIVARHGLAVCVGLAERVRDKIYNSAALFSGTGHLLTVHRKTHLWGEFERKHFTAASDLPRVVTLGEVVVAVCICYEVEFPEMTRAVRRKGAHALFVPTAACGGMDSMRPIVHVLVPARAFENGMYVFYCNRAGDEGGMEFRGMSVVGTPEGKVEGEQGHEHASFSVVTVSLPALEKARREHPFLADLRANIF